MRGDANAAAVRYNICKALPLLPITDGARLLATALIACGAVPKTKPEDALHIAIAATSQMDYIASWNFAHLVGTQPKLALQRHLKELGFPALVIATPEEIVEDFSA